MERWTPAQRKAGSGGEWYSSAELPVESCVDDYGFDWHFTRWLVNGMKVETAKLVAPAGFPMAADGGGIWEAGPEIWPHIRAVPFAGYPLPVVPLEIQLQTALQRGMMERAADIVVTLRQRGYDEALLRRSLTADHLARFEALRSEPIAA
jgi:hypothetical protein